MDRSRCINNAAIALKLPTSGSVLGESSLDIPIPLCDS